MFRLDKLALLFLVALFAGLVVPASAQPVRQWTATDRSVIDDRQFFSSMKVCKATPKALVIYYQPRDASRLPAWKARHERHEVGLSPLKQDHCHYGSTEHGLQYTRVRAGTEMFTHLDTGKCAADTRCGNPPIEDEAVPETTPPSTPPPPENPPPSAPPSATVSFGPPPVSCVVTGNTEEGYGVLAINGQVEGKEKVRPPEDLPPGRYKIVFRVAGPGGVVTCERPFTIEGLLLVGFPKIEPQGRHGWQRIPCAWVWTADIKHDWKKKSVVIERIGCAAAAVTGGLAAAGAFGLSAEKIAELAAGSGILP